MTVLRFLSGFDRAEDYSFLTPEIYWVELAKDPEEKDAIRCGEREWGRGYRLIRREAL
jgi:hypothetical protein